jgi:hypothetical protein
VDQLRVPGRAIQIKRRVLALGTGQRNLAAALVVASESFSDPKVVGMVIVVTIVGLLTLIPVCYLLANRSFKQRGTNVDKIIWVSGTLGILAGFLFITLGFGIGWMLGGPAPDTLPK